MTLAACLLALTALRVAALWANQTDLFFDEAQYWTWSREPAFGYFSKPPLIAWIVALTTGFCGDGEACLRLPSPLLYAAAAAFVYLTAEALYDARVGFWSALVFATAPGVSFSATLISTDVPLLLFWSMALWAGVRFARAPSWGWAAVAGVAIGLGLLAKYAMVYFYLCAGLWLLAHAPARRRLKDPRALLLLLVPAAIVAPNLLWNLGNGMATLGHTAANANWGGPLLNPIRGLEFLGAQFGVFGPIAFAALIVVAVRATRVRPSGEDGLLLAFSLPVLVVVVGQAFLSRAHANWAATAYPAASILVTAVLLRGGWRRLFAASLGLHLFVAGVAATAPAFADRLALPGRLDPYGRMLGWSDLARVVGEHATHGGYKVLLTDDRRIAAELLYYLRDMDLDVRGWPRGPTPRDHYELTRPFVGDAAGPVLLVSTAPSTAAIEARFARATPVAGVTVPAGPKGARALRLVALEGYRSGR